MNDSFYQRVGKRVFDLLIVFCLAPFWLPVILLVTVLVWLRLGRPIFYCQDRPGRYGKLFTLIKFRTMTNAEDGHGRLLVDEQRLTAFGSFLRSTSLDELPELWNVFRGKMSLVGPRPLLKEYLHLYTPEQARRHQARPGITGLAQVRGRNAISWEQKFAYDLQYIEKLSLGLDCRVLLETVTSILRRDGISAEAHATCPAFSGSKTMPGAQTKKAA